MPSKKKAHPVLLMYAPELVHMYFWCTGNKCLWSSWSGFSVASCVDKWLTLALITSTKQELNFVFKGNYPSLHFWCVCKGLCTSILEVHQHKHLWSSWSGFSLTSCIHKWRECSVTNLLPPDWELKHSVETSAEMFNLKLLRRSHLSIFPWRNAINLRSPFNDISYIARYYHRYIFIANREHSNMLKRVLFVELNNGEKRHWDHCP